MSDACEEDSMAIAALEDGRAREQGGRRGRDSLWQLVKVKMWMNLPTLLPIPCLAHPDPWVTSPAESKITEVCSKSLNL